MTQGLEITTLGELRITLGGAPLPKLASRKAEALLVYLACTGRPQQRDVLAELLWDDLPAARARGNLSVLLTSLRQAVGPYLEIGRFQVALARAGPLRLDCAELAQVAEATLPGSRLGPGLQPAEARRLEAVLALYGGDFLHGFALRDGAGFEAWVRAEQERLRALVVRARHALARTALDAADYAAGIDQAQALLRLEPLDEDAHYLLLLLYSHAGRRGAALAHYEQLRRSLEAELGVTPAQRSSELYQQIWQGSFAADAPMLPASASRLPPSPAALPVPPTVLIGREHELALLLALLRPAAPREPARLLTLTGPGGVGKTRLALAVATALCDSFADGAAFVDLAAVHDPALVPATLARALDVAEGSGQNAQATLVAHLGDEHRLLVIDNFEQVVAAAPLVAALVTACPRLVMIVTSRTPLRIQVEQQFDVLPLALPGRSIHARRSEVAASGAVQLFEARAQAVQPRFVVTDGNAATVAELCRQLDGLPLAIELAAARVRTLPPASLLQQLAHRLVILAGGGSDRPERHRTVRATIAWSYDLLSDDARFLFRRMVVFAGGCTLEAIERVCRPDGSLDVFAALVELVDQSLLLSAVEPDGTARFRTLETIRDYGLERLGEGTEADALRQRHAAYFVALAEAAMPDLIGPRQGVWLERLEAEHGNLRAALEWACRRELAEPALRLTVALWRFWYMHGHLSEGRRWLAAALALRPVRHGDMPFAKAGLLPATRDEAAPDVDARSSSGPSAAYLALYATALNAAGVLSLHQSDYAAARAFVEQSLELGRRLGATTDIAGSLNTLGNIAYAQGAYTAAREHHQESLLLRRALGATPGIAASLNNLGLVAEAQADYAAARALYEEALALQRELSDNTGIAYALHNLGSIAYMQTDYPVACTLLEDSLVLKRELGDKWGIATSLSILGNLALAEGNVAAARARHEESLGLVHELGDKSGIAQCLEGLAGVAAKTQALRAIRLASAAAALRDATGAFLSPLERANLERWLLPARLALGADASATASLDGCAMSLEEVIAYAMDDTARPREEPRKRAAVR